MKGRPTINMAWNEGESLPIPGHVYIKWYGFTFTNSSARQKELLHSDQFKQLDFTSECMSLVELLMHRCMVCVLVRVCVLVM